jgi:hypothetical protein
MHALQMRLAYNGLIYRKVSIKNDSMTKCNYVNHQVLRLSSHSTNTFSTGKITNIFSNDASQVEMTLIFWTHVWVSSQIRRVLTLSGLCSYTSKKYYDSPGFYVTNTKKCIIFGQRFMLSRNCFASL